MGRGGASYLRQALMLAAIVAVTPAFAADKASSKAWGNACRGSNPVGDVGNWRFGKSP